jgi:DNA replication protein DnaD
LKNKKVTDWKNLYAAIKNDKRLLPLAKSGVWTLTEWEEENLIIYELITNTLLHFNKPLIKEDIFSHILKTRPFIRTHSLNSAIYNSRFMQLRDKKFILSEWKDLYQKKK